MAQIMQLLDNKRTFREFHLELMLFQQLKDCLDMLYVLLECVAIDQYVIYENHDTLPEQWSEHMVHDGLECSWSTNETIWHNHVFKVPMMSLEGCFILIIRVH